jgi:hypothetical protein
MRNLKLGLLGLLALVCAALAFEPAFAANGKLSGVVKDSQTGEVLPGANVTVTVGGQTLGGTTDGSGRYFILNVPPGVHNVKASFVGYQTVTKTEAKVSLDLTTAVDFSLAPQANAGGELVVTAERPPVEKSQTASRSTISASEINNTMPVGDVQGLIDTAPSVYRGFIRGGRKADSKILVDGIDVSDTYFRAGEGVSVYSPYTSSNRSSGSEYAAVGVNASSVQELDIISGTFNAEYDAASAGVINIVTKDGSRTYDGRVFFRLQPGGVKNAGPDVYEYPWVPTGTSTDNRTDLKRYQDERATLLASTTPANVQKGNLYNFALDQVDYGNKSSYEADLSLGGPLGGRGGFFATYRRLKDYGFFPNEKNSTMRYSLKLNQNVTENAKLTGSMMVDDGGKLGGWVNYEFSSRYKYFPVGYVGNKKLGWMGYAGLTHTLSPNTFYEVKISKLNRTTEIGYSDDNANGRVEVGENGDFIIIDDPTESTLYLGVGGSSLNAAGQRTFFTSDPGNEGFHNVAYATNQYRVGQPGFFYDKTDRNVFQIKADVTSQVNYNNQLKAGLLYRYHTVGQFQQRTQVRVTFDNQFPFETTDWTLHPAEYAAFVQDRIEYEGIIINAGVRLDGFDTGANSFGNYFRPSTTTTAANGRILRNQVLDEEVPVRWFWQPRLGVSHPVGDRAALHYSWGKFYSAPPFSEILDGYGVFSNPSLPFVVDVNSEPSTATAYEIGLQYGITPEYLVDLTAYLRDIDNYSNIGYSINPSQAAPAPGFATYTFNTSFGYADSRGIELALSKRPGRYPISGRASYAFSYVKASAYSTDTPFPDKTAFNALADSAAGINFDDRFTFNTYEINVGAGGNALTGGFDREHRLSLSLLAEFPYGFTASLITQAESGFNYRVTATSTDLRSRETDRGPWTFNTDLRLTKSVKFAQGYSGSAFFEVRNLFDRENVLSYETTLPTDQAKWEQSVKDGKPDPTGTLNRAFSQEGISLYGPPRVVNIGATLDF